MCVASEETQTNHFTLLTTINILFKQAQLNKASKNYI